MNCVTICRAKYLSIVTLIVSPTSCFRYNLEEKRPKIPDSENEAKQS